ncbi:MAG: DUF1778 domain-containing protein [Alphaproteobacteria bacterium]
MTIRINVTTLSLQSLWQTANRKPQTADRRPQTANRKPQTANRRPQTADRKPQTANRRKRKLAKPMKKPSKNNLVNLRVTQADLDLIDRGAECEGLNRTEFVTNAATARAHTAIQDRMNSAVCFVSARDFDDALALVSQAPAPSSSALQQVAKARSVVRGHVGKYV